MPDPANTASKTSVPRLTQSASLLARVLDHAAIGTAIAGMDGTILYANRALVTLLGRSVDGRSLLELVHADDNAAGKQRLAMLLRGEAQSYRGEHRFVHADGSPLWVMVAISALAAEGEQPACLVAQVTDIELQKKAEEALAYSESRWNFALEGAGQGVWDHDIVNDVMFYSRMWRLMRGMAPDAVVDGDQEKWLDRVHPDDRQKVRDNVHRQDSGDASFDALEYRERKADGSYVWILSRGKPVEWDAQGHPVRTLGTDTDITRLKTIELELAAEKEMLRVTLDSIADGMMSADAQGRVMFMNPAAEQLTGLTAQQAIGRDVRDVFQLRDGASGAVQECPVALCLASERIAQIDDDMLLVGHDGNARDIRCTAAPLRMPDGALGGAVLVFQDVTESRTMQRQLAHTATHDDLTGLPNRAAFERALNGGIARARDGRHRHCLLYVDLDRFKPVNDTAGHAAGDALLKQVAQTLRGVCRSHDVPARIGGDEFAVLLNDCSPENGKLVADKIVRAIASLAFLWAGRTYRIGASVGFTEIAATPASPLGFMGEADAACYAAKARGRGVAVGFREL